MASLVAAARHNDFPAEIALVLSNRPDALGLAFAKEHNVATAAVDHKIYAGREAFEAVLQQMLETHRIDLVCLAGFMRLLTPSFTQRWQGRMLNIHPALLPSYKGLHTHERAIADGVKIHGCTVHFVVPEMDSGPIIAQAAVPVLDTDTAETLGARVLSQEHVIYPRALEYVASDRVKIDGNRVVGACAHVEHSPLVVPGLDEEEDG
jgi:phosphoribosylglycinamide formyltransferase-1